MGIESDFKSCSMQEVGLKVDVKSPFTSKINFPHFINPSLPSAASPVLEEIFYG